eukprot:TRINITY_DN209_c0_g4_i1.p1 TRINITY_DN209_c0_g4~~TRINITY_DN209_c0_g4_i1.p1  ORF type:complete len:230 (-),score=81.97 TRINITY_DN209_c0_g4_i1:73-762(-)
MAQKIDDSWRLNLIPSSKRLSPIFSFEILNKNIELQQGMVSDIDSIGKTVWDGGIVLSKYFEKKFVDIFKDKNVLELGSGTGLAGITAGLLGAKITLTDYDDGVLDLLRINSAKYLQPHQFRVIKYSWGEKAIDLQGPFDYIIGSDIIYYHNLAPLLQQSLIELATDNTEIILANDPFSVIIQNNFFTSIEHVFTIEKIEIEEHHEIYRSEDISIFKLKKKINSNSNSN